jgi:predicted membrane protein
VTGLSLLIQSKKGFNSMVKVLKPEAIIMAVLNEIGSTFPDKTVQNITDLILHNEPGVALEVLCAQIFEYGIELSYINKSNLRQAARLMNIPFFQLEGLADA